MMIPRNRSKKYVVVATIHRAVGITSEQSQTLGLAVDGKPVEELF